MTINYVTARALLDEVFAESESLLLQGQSCLPLADAVSANCDRLFTSATQAYREALLGCVLARIQDRTINISHPYAGHSPDAFNGRTLDENAVNPFLQDHRIPSSRGPYLSVFRRSVKFTSETRSGVRDKAGFDAFVECVELIKNLDNDADLKDFLQSLLYRFAVLREASNVALNKLIRFSSDQYEDLLRRLLDTPSGGRFPLFLVVAGFTSIKEHFKAEWTISYQGINVADGASGAGGDVTLLQDNEIVLSAEITERVVDRSRVVSTFNTKIGPNRIEDYLFFVLSDPSSDAREQGHQYFAQGHEITFVNIQRWVTMILATVGKGGRSIFNNTVLTLLDSPDVPKSLKVAWNDHVSKVISGPG